ncbi:hypothetical protein QQ020_21680 [Fulvivirgaceae bacterium BMA12]|uniref:ATP-binding protein n=1 Tax=Agaribacillus aureus TaxID=3051825 RepID=A0ABT8LAC2_9BACT|nr:hypothetical protein [Fulvivirgaceae bacterium BMA12]
MNDILQQFLNNRRDNKFLIPVGMQGSGKSSLLATYFQAIESSKEYDFLMNINDDSANKPREEYLNNIKYNEIPNATEAMSKLNAFYAMDASFEKEEDGLVWEFSCFDFSGLDFEGIHDQLLSKSKIGSGESKIGLERHLLAKPLYERDEKANIRPVIFGNLLDELFVRLESECYLFLIADGAGNTTQQDKFLNQFIDYLLNEENRWLPALEGVFFFISKWDLLRDQTDFKTFVKEEYKDTFAGLKRLYKNHLNVMSFPFSVGNVEKNSRNIQTLSMNYAHDLLLYMEATVFPKHGQSKF